MAEQRGQCLPAEVSACRGVCSMELVFGCVFCILGRDSQREGTARILLCAEVTL